MGKALIVHHSQTGRTRRYGEEISDHLATCGVSSQMVSAKEFRPEMLEGVDHLLLGCWTHGLMVVLQHPDKEWVAFAKALPALGPRKVTLFTTYLIATGSMFWVMKKHLKGKADGISLQLKSRNAELSQADKERLRELVAS